MGIGEGAIIKKYGMELSQNSIRATCDSLKDFLLEKNKRYGDSALNPSQVFSKMSAVDGICQRIDDKLKRVKNSPELRKNDIADLAGYLILLSIAKDWTNFSDLID